ncbi:hypothetical protein ISS37_05315 [candidate division KSB1 bacterium]|nr:hypothetical protein [candidate division KSB1 bacterium]
MRRSKSEKIASKLSKYFNIPPPRIDLWDSIPDYFYPDVSSSYLDKRGNGFYIPSERTIVLESFNQKMQKRYSDEALLHCFAHEFVHHLETVLIGEFPSHRGS